MWDISTGNTIWPFLYSTVTGKSKEVGKKQAESTANSVKQERVSNGEATAVPEEKKPKHEESKQTKSSTSSEGAAAASVNQLTGNNSH